MPLDKHHNRTTPAKILVFDSGVGGLSVLQEIRANYPHCHLFYGSDNAAFPYGTKAEETLIERVDQVLHRLQSLSQADIIVIACNTASTIALPRIRERFAQPVIGVVPAIKPAAQLSSTGIIGLLATPGTIQRDYTQQLIKEFAQNCQVIRVGSSELVWLAEKKLRGETVTQEALAPIIAPFKQASTHLPVDTIVLACTHFPFLKQELQQALPQVVHWVDSGAAIARRVGYWIKELHLPTQESATPYSTAYFTQSGQEIITPTNILTELGIETIEYLPA